MGVTPWYARTCPECGARYGSHGPMNAQTAPCGGLAEARLAVWPVSVVAASVCAMSRQCSSAVSSSTSLRCVLHLVESPVPSIKHTCSCYVLFLRASVALYAHLSCRL